MGMTEGRAMGKGEESHPATRKPRRDFLVTGGGGFVGGNFARLVLRDRPDSRVTVFDTVSDPTRIPVLRGLPETYPGRYRYVRGAVTDGPFLEKILSGDTFDAVVHFAARNPSGQAVVEPIDTVRVNVLGTAAVLDALRRLDPNRAIRFLHLSSYEVYGSHASGLFRENTDPNPSTPYAASKCAADELTLAFHRTFGLDALVTRTTNIYGPFQSADKLIPSMVRRAMDGRSLPLFGSGDTRRDWIHVDDHNRGVLCVLDGGKAGEIYHLGARNEVRNEDLLRRVAERIAALTGRSRKELLGRITSVEDRRAHDPRRALDTSKIEGELGYLPSVPFEEGLGDTIQHFVQNEV